jgi:hypothetical protein
MCRSLHDCFRGVCTLVVLTCGMMGGVSAFAAVSASTTDVLAIPPAPDSVEVSITVTPSWVIRFDCNHDAQELVCRIYNLSNGDAKRFPELLVDAQNKRSTRWKKGQWWLHSSYNLCEGNGEFNLYKRDGVFQCSKQKSGWKANTFPLKENEPMEIHISLAKLRLVPGRDFGLAFDVTDTQTRWNFWPEGAKLESPFTWSKARLIPASR